MVYLSAQESVEFFSRLHTYVVEIPTWENLSQLNMIPRLHLEMRLEEADPAIWQHRIPFI